MARYTVRAKDPSNEFVRVVWETEWLPRMGDTVDLPDKWPTGEHDWQGLIVVEVVHRPGPIGVEIWVGGTDGWAPGSLIRLFECARQWALGQRRRGR